MKKRCRNQNGTLLLAGIVLCLLCPLSGPARSDVLQGIPGIEWTVGPAQVPLGTIGTLNVPAGYRFTGPAGARIFEELEKNPMDTSELGVLIPPLEQFADPDASWEIRFHFIDAGFVKDDEKNLLGDPATLLEAIRKNTDTGNEERRKRGWSEVKVIGWQQPPAYDSVTHQLTWAVLTSEEKGRQGVNYNSLILGRSGYISMLLYVLPNQLFATIPTCRMIEGQINFNSGQTYQEFRSGDKVAQYGLTALITGAGTVAAFKVWKPLVAAGAAVVAVLVAMGRKIKGFFTGKSPAPSKAASAGHATVIVTCPRCTQKNNVTGGAPGAVCGRCKSPLS